MRLRHMILRRIALSLYVMLVLMIAAPMGTARAADVSSIVGGMTTDEKVSQLIVPAIRSWDGTNVTDLAAAPDLASALRAHQYGGIILFGQNVSDTEQVARLVAALQANNAAIPNASAHIPYLMPVDEEGGVVTRLTSGTRMTGSMAIGATGAAAETNAQATGRVIGEELAALGFNVDFAPDIDVNSNPSNPIIGTRSFSDDPNMVAKLGPAFATGLAQSNVIATYKHFPGHGDTDTDSHTGLPSVNKSKNELDAVELVPFRMAIARGADLIMTAHISFPQVDEEVEFADGSRGYYPATMSPRMMSELLRGELGYSGVVVTDALEMDAIDKGRLVAGAEGSVEYRANIAQKVIMAGVDLLLLPTDLKDAAAASFYDDYVSALVARAEADPSLMARIDESVGRILALKDKYGILDVNVSGDGIAQVIAKAKAVVGSAEHHAAEAEIARKAVTLVKNTNATLPLSGHGSQVVIIGRLPSDNVTIIRAIDELKDKGVIAPDALVDNFVTGTTSGSEDAGTRITIDYYYDTSDGGKLHFTQDLRSAISEADAVVGVSFTSGLGTLGRTSAQWQGMNTALEAAHEAGGRFVQLSDNLPYDATRYPEADAVMLAYMGAGLAVSPIAVQGSGNVGAINANVVAAIEAMFDEVAPTGTVPVNLPGIVEADDGSLSYSTEIVYPRGFGLSYSDAYRFLEGGGSRHARGDAHGLDFRTNARHDRLTDMSVDGAKLAASDYQVVAGSTHIVLPASYLDTLEVGEHVLVASYDYGSGPFSLSTSFAVADTSVTDDPSVTDAAAPTRPAGAATPASTQSGSSPLPKTGDVAGPFALLAACAAGAIVLGVALRRHR